MQRQPIEGYTGLHDVVTGVYEVVFEEDLRPDDVELYAIESPHVEAEIEFPSIGINRRQWTEEWSPERRLEVLLHEFAHVEEAPDELDHDPAFYERLMALAENAADNAETVETLFDAAIDFRAVKRHIVDSVNEYTIESHIDTVADRQAVLRDELALPEEPASD
jgi:isocitrate dehydrogenase